MTALRDSWLGRYLLPSWSVPAAMRAVRATLVVPAILALTFKVFGNPQMALFAVFGSFAALVLTTFGGTRRDKAVAHLGLALVGSIGVILGTVASGSAPLAAVLTLLVAFFIYFAGMAGPNAASGVTGALLAYVIAVASAGGTAAIGDRLAGWWLASAVSTVAVLLLSPRTAGDRLRRSAAALARAIAQHLTAAVNGKATTASRDATRAAKHDLMTLFDASPYRPTGLAAADQALGSLISLLEWCSSLACEAMDGHLDLSDAAAEDTSLLIEAAAALDAVAQLLEGQDDEPSLERVWHARVASAAHLRGLTGDPATVRRMADQAFHAQAIGVAASAAAADALIASRRLDPESVTAQRHRWLSAHAAPLPAALAHAAPAQSAPVQSAPAQSAPVQSAPVQSASPGEDTPYDGADGVELPARRPWRPPLMRAGSTIAADASIRSVWFRNAARGAIAIAAAVTIARLTDVQHAFWVVLGTLSVLRSSAGATGSTALRALAGTALGFFVGAALLIGIGTGPVALWVALPLAVIVAAYTPGTAPFVVGQAAFTVVVVVLFNLLAPAGWQVGLVRVEDVAIGCGVSVVVGLLFWPRGASALVGDNLADSLRAGAAHLAEATDWALGRGGRSQQRATAAAAATIRLDDAVRGYLTEQGSKRLAKQDLWTLTMSALRLRLTAHSLASLPGLGAARGPAAQHPIGHRTSDTLSRESTALTDFYEAIATEIGRPAGTLALAPPVAVPAGQAEVSIEPCTIGPAHYHPEALWVRDHLSHLASHSAELVGPAARLAALRRRAWWR
jgi:uncharacterized membrane protein YccC